MEFVIILAVIIVLLLILGVNVYVIIQGLLWLMEVILIGMTLFFLLSIILLLLGKWQDAAFLRVEKEGSFGHAVYRLGDAEHRNLYPAEGFLQNLIYRKTSVRVRFWEHGRLHARFDRYSIRIAALGLPLSAAGAVLLGMFLLWM